MIEDDISDGDGKLLTHRETHSHDTPDVIFVRILSEERL